MFKKSFIYFIVIFIIFSTYLVIYAKETQKSIAENVIRLHIIANSNNEDDQEIKLKIRDVLLKYIDSKNFSSKDEALSYISKNINLFENVANKVLKEEGVAYTARVLLDKSFFTSKNYGDISLPSGNYLALKVLLGENGGKNWWCVMFPPLCFTESATSVVSDNSDKLLENSLSDDDYYLIHSSTEIRFKVVDLINKYL